MDPPTEQLRVSALGPCLCFGLDDGDDAGGGHFRDGTPVGHSPGKALESLIFGAQQLELGFNAGILRDQLLHLVLELDLLLLQLLLLRHTLHSTAGGVASVLERASTLFQLQDFIFGQTAQVLVQLSHRHGHQFIIRKTRAILTWLSLHLECFVSLVCSSHATRAALHCPARQV